MSSTDKMLGKKHDPQCDCNIEHIVSGTSEKCNRRYGVSRARAQEKRSWKKEVQTAS